jgi:hypothetical protein
MHAAFRRLEIKYWLILTCMQSKERVRKRGFIDLWSFRLSLELWAMGSLGNGQEGT